METPVSKRSSKRTPSSYRRPAPVPASPEAAIPDELLRAFPHGIPPENAARAAMRRGQGFLFQNRIRSAERWLAIASRFVTLGRGIDALAGMREQALLEAESQKRSMQMFDDIWVELGIDKKYGPLDGDDDED
jgi:hypothetical protein